MYQDHCLYCGSSDIIPVDEEHYLEQNLHILQCQNCKIMFTELEQRMEADTTPLDYKPDFDVSDEEAVLEAVWKEWRHNTDTDLLIIRLSKWNRTLELLFQHKYPLHHPAEYIIFRDIWQICDALHCYNILKEAKNYDHVYACNLLLDLLINNLQNIDHYLYAYTEKQQMRALQRICCVTAYLQGQPIFISCKLDPKQIDYYTASIMQKRVDALRALAKQLEDLHNTSHGLEFLKMAGELWRKSMGSSLILGTKHRRMHPEKDKLRATEKKIKDIEESIRRVDPKYRIAKTALRQSNPPISGKTAAICFVPFLAIFLYYTVSHRIDYSLDCFLSPLLYSVCIIWMIAACTFRAVKYEKSIHKDSIKRKQIYNRLYKTADKETL